MKVGDLVTWKGWTGNLYMPVGLVATKTKDLGGKVTLFRILWCEAAATSYTSVCHPTELEVISESR